MPAPPADLRRLTVLVLASTYPRWAGDPEPGFVHELCKRLSIDHRIIVICPHATGALTTEMLDGVEVVRYRYAPERWEVLVNNGGIVNNLRRRPLMAFLLPGFVFFQLWTAIRFTRLHRIDAIHAHWLIPQGLIAALVGRLFARKTPFVVTSHGADLYALRGRLMNFLKCFVAKRANAITVVSDVMQSDITHLEVDANKITVQPMGIDLDNRFTPDSATERSSDEILFVGRLVEKKGLRYLLDAMPAIRAARPSVCLKIVGFGPEEAALREQVHRMQLNDIVHFIGPVQQADLPAFYRRAAVFVAPFVRASNGDIEGLGLVVAEAIGCHCPVVVGDVPATKDVIADGEGKVISPLDAAALAGAIIATLEDPKSALDSVERARLRLDQQLSWSVVSAGYSKLLRKICASTDAQLAV
ncbi:glycosyltransferase [Variovorax paradoxus]|uniref:glycosyltransferase n=1 Tax=Variovorax paradoxus TaxID=34073 RepID=UPI002855E02F|nr:glycosyltransferase [Variovorax paradoxus]MDR6453092.1 glycosyltransferase involved in cell wall biosynthesis [Variovorax paradoxus]